MQCQTYVRLLARRNDSLQKVGDVLPQLFIGMNAFVGNRGQVLDLIDVECGVARSPAAFFQVVTFDRPMRIPVVLNYRQAYLACSANRTLEVFDFLVALCSRSSVNTVV